MFFLPRDTLLKPTTLGLQTIQHSTGCTCTFARVLKVTAGVNIIVACAWWSALYSLTRTPTAVVHVHGTCTCQHKRTAYVPGSINVFRDKIYGLFIDFQWPSFIYTRTAIIIYIGEKEHLTLGDKWARKQKQRGSGKVFVRLSVKNSKMGERHGQCQK